MRRKPIPGRRITIPADLTQASVYMRKSLSLCSIQQRSVCSADCLALTELTRTSEPNCLYGEKLARLKTCEQALLGALAVGREKEGIN